MSLGVFRRRPATVRPNWLRAAATLTKTAGGGGGGVDLLDSLAHVWTFEAATGTVADEIGSADLTVLSGSPSAVTGKHGNAVHYDASGDSHRTTGLSLSFPFTVSVRFEVRGSSGDKLFEFSGSGGSLLKLTTGRSPNAGQLVLSSTGSTGGVISPAGLADGWHHAVIRATSGTVKVDVDGVAYSASHTATVSVNTLTLINDSGGSATEPYRDEVYVWDRELSDAECDSLYASGAGRFWPFTVPAATAEWSVDSLAGEATAAWEIASYAEAGAATATWTIEPAANPATAAWLLGSLAGEAEAEWLTDSLAGEAVAAWSLETLVTAATAGWSADPEFSESSIKSIKLINKADLEASLTNGVLI